MFSECEKCQELQIKLDNLQGEVDRAEIALNYLQDQLSAGDKTTSRHIDTLKETIASLEKSMKVRDRSFWVLAFQTSVFLLAVIAYMFKEYLP